MWFTTIFSPFPWFMIFWLHHILLFYDSRSVMLPLRSHFCWDYFFIMKQWGFLSSLNGAHAIFEARDCQHNQRHHKYRHRPFFTWLFYWLIMLDRLKADEWTSQEKTESRQWIKSIRVSWQINSFSGELLCDMIGGWMKWDGNQYRRYFLDIQESVSWE